MAWHDDPNHPFGGIAEKIKRSEQNIANLNAEIEGFIQSGEYQVVPDPDTPPWKEATAYHRNKPIPLRFSVLAGEVVHHLRSCLDHIIWHFADAAGRATGVIEFPVFDVEPTKNTEIERYERKIKGITNTSVLALIKEMQPYQVGPDVAGHSLLILHNMDRFDKHRELMMIRSSVQVDFQAASDKLRRKAELYSQGKLPESEYRMLGRALKDHKATPGVAFPEFGQYRPYPVIKGLAQLLLFVDGAVTEFAAEI